MGQGGYGHMGGYGMMGGAQARLTPWWATTSRSCLGIDHADIHAAHVAGKSLFDIAAEKGVSEDQ